MTRTRLYQGSDARLIETSRTIHALFVANLSDFNSFDAQLNTSFATQWKVLMDQCSTREGNSLIRSRQAQITATVQEKMEEARKKYQMMKYFVGTAFKNDPKVMNEFGASDFPVASRMQPYMILFLNQLHNAASKYKPQLLTAGCSEAFIDSIKDIQVALENTNLNQESYMKARPVLTAQRLELMNECYRTLVRVISAARVVYYDDEVKAAQYTLGNYTRVHHADEMLKGTVAAGSRRDVFTLPYNARQSITIRNQGPQALLFYFCNEIPTPLGTPLQVLPGNEVHVLASQLATEGNIFAVYNANNELPGVFEIELS